MRWIIRAIVLFGLIVGGFVLAERLILYAFDPRRIAPEIAGVSELTVQSATGNTMYVWVAEAKPGKPTILYLHGNAGGLADRTPRLTALTKRGFGLVAPAYRGSSGSAGWPSETSIRTDIKGLYEALVSGALTGTPIRPILYGESIGAAVAIQLNAAIVTTSNAPRAIILEAPFTSLRDVAHAIQPELVLATGFMTSHWRSLEAAPKITAPLLILHGENDPLIPLDQGRAILNAAASRDKELFVVPEAGHINVWKVTAQRRLYQFLADF